MKGIFISYRRQDTAGYAGRLYDRLAHHFGADRVFMDVEGIEPGLDFVDAIERAVGSCEVLIVIIGPGWLATDSAGKRRLDDPKDFVRIETGAALGRHIRVVPVLVDKAVMPLAEELPADLAPLVRRQAIELSNKYWDATTGELIRTLERVLDGDKAAGERIATAAGERTATAAGERMATAAGGRMATAATATQTDPDDEPLLVVNKRDIRRPWVIAGALALIAAAIGLYLAHPWDDSGVQKADDAAAPPKTAAVQPPEKAGPTAEKLLAPEKSPAPVPEKPPAPPTDKSVAPVSPGSAEPPADHIASTTKDKPSLPLAQNTAPSNTAPAKTTAPAKAAPENTASAKATPEKTAPAKTAPAKTAAPDSSKAAQQPHEKIAVATPVQPTEKPSAPVAATPTPPSVTPPATPPVTPPVTPPSTSSSTQPVTPPSTPPSATASMLPATLPRVGDSWEYRMRSKWPTVPARTYTHRVTAVSASEVAQTVNVSPSPDGGTLQRAFTPGTRFVEWRGPGFYLLEFNPFLDAFGVLQKPAAITELPAMPPENPMYGSWTSRARVRGSESVTVPAGTFNSLKLEIDSTRAPIESAGGQSREPIRTVLTVWYAPDVKRMVKMVRLVLTPQGSHLDEDTYELVRYRVQ